MITNTNINIKEYTSPERLSFSNKINILHKSFVNSNLLNNSAKTINNNSLSSTLQNQSVIFKVINNSFNKDQKNLVSGAAITNFLSTSKAKTIGSLSTEYKSKKLINTNSKDFENNNNINNNINNTLKNNSNGISNNYNTINISSAAGQATLLSENKKFKFNLNFNNTTTKTIIEKSESETEKDVENNKEVVNTNDEMEVTAKIKYKYVAKLLPTPSQIEKSEQRKNIYFWFAAYDKLMKNKHIKKIFHFYDKDKTDDKSSNPNVNYTYSSKLTSGHNNSIVGHFSFYLKNFFQ